MKDALVKDIYRSLISDTNGHTITHLKHGITIKHSSNFNEMPCLQRH